MYLFYTQTAWPHRLLVDLAFPPEKSFRTALLGSVWDEAVLSDCFAEAKGTQAQAWDKCATGFMRIVAYFAKRIVLDVEN